MPSLVQTETLESSVKFVGKNALIKILQEVGDLMDMMALTNSAINFILYCTMSRQFRVTFSEIFKIKQIVKWTKASQTAPEDQGAAETKMSLV
ncbi:hypothetical protein NQ317_013596 [Molorchus minor]|uniref:Uncharacterized protein n=1 Tax=Molorchus minor TaxID=1323400 RepID=A0ABQ9J6N7_9CUCU|nr:hypothetical protein NQ317_013596 [Molorchus minor]